MLKDRFRKFLPVIVDLETGGFDPQKNAILEIAIQLIEQEKSKLILGESHRYHIKPFDGLKVDKEALEFLKLDLNHPLSCLLYTSPSPRDLSTSRMPSSA